jgi:cyclase
LTLSGWTPRLIGVLEDTTITEVARGVFAFVQQDGSWWINNAGFVVGTDRVVVIDTASTERRVRSLRGAISAVTAAPVRTVINTHHHGDHTNGNCLFPDAAVMGRTRCRTEVERNRIGGVDAIWGPVDWGALEMRPPDVTFESDAELFVDGRRIALIGVGAAAHTTNDLVAWLPEDGVLFAGDLVFNGGTPFVLMGSVAGSLAALARIRALRPRVIVPGHGPVCGVGALDEVESYLRFVQGRALAGREEAQSPLEAARATDLGQFAAWHDTERLVGNLYRAYSELDGNPIDADIDVMSAFRDMIAFNGGNLLRCLA